MPDKYDEDEVQVPLSKRPFIEVWEEEGTEKPFPISTFLPIGFVLVGIFLLFADFTTWGTKVIAFLFVLFAAAYMVLSIKNKDDEWYAEYGWLQFDRHRKENAELTTDFVNGLISNGVIDRNTLYRQFDYEVHRVDDDTVAFWFSLTQAGKTFSNIKAKVEDISPEIGAYRGECVQYKDDNGHKYPNQYIATFDFYDEDDRFRDVR